MFPEIISHNRCAFHHELHVLKQSYVRNGVTMHRDEIRVFSNRYLSNSIAPTHQVRGIYSATSNDVDVLHSLILKLL